MKHLTQVLLALFWKFGGPGLLVLGILDSSFLFAPLGNDLLVVALTARKHSIPLMLYYAGMSTIGSVLGCLLVDVVLRKAGEKGLEKHLSKRRLEYVKRKVTNNAAWALVIASVAPPAQANARGHRRRADVPLHRSRSTRFFVRQTHPEVGRLGRCSVGPHRPGGLVHDRQYRFRGGLDPAEPQGYRRTESGPGAAT